jgi:site-specific recombinase XerD
MPRLSELIRKYVVHCRDVRRLSPHTIAAYENGLRQFATIFGRSGRLTRSEIRRCLLRIAEDPRLAPRTVKRRVAAIRVFLRSVDEKLALVTFGAWKLAVRTPIRLPRSIARPDLNALLKTSHSEALAAPAARTAGADILLAAEVKSCRRASKGCLAHWDKTRSNR